jgi:hypothetical protein
MRVSEAFWAAAFMHDMTAGDKPTVFKRLTRAPQVTEGRAEVPGRRPVPFDLYRPARARAALAPLIVTHGFTHEGRRDARLRALCDRLARLGWAVIVPEFPQMRQYRLGLDDTDDLETVALALPSLRDIAAERLGVVAFSFGAAPVLIGLTRAPVRQYARFALVFGGCYDLGHAIRYVLTGAYDIGGLSGRVRMPTERDDRWKFLKGNLQLLLCSPATGRFLRVVDSRIADPCAPVDLSGCSDLERSVFALIDNRDPNRYRALYAPVASYLEPWIAALSPAAVAPQITTPLVIVHSTTDQKTHYSESVALGRAVPAAPPPLIAIVGTFAHVDLALRHRSVRTWRTEVLPGLQQLWRVVRVLVSGARRARAQEHRAAWPFDSSISNTIDS